MPRRKSVDAPPPAPHDLADDETAAAASVAAVDESMDLASVVADLEPIRRMSKDLKAAAQTMGAAEARYLVDTYYDLQRYRTQAALRVRDLTKSGEPTGVSEWFLGNAKVLEDGIRAALDVYGNSHPMGRWARSHIGIGPVIAAGLLAHIDVTRQPSAGHLWAFAGVDPSKQWTKGQRRPWNASLKVIVWKIGKSFVYFHNRPDCFYGQIYAKRKQYETTKNLAGDYKAQAEETLRTKNIGKDTEAYQWYAKGMLPPARIQQRAERYAAKLFLAHLWEAWRHHLGLPVPLPYPIAHLGHVDKIDSPVPPPEPNRPAVGQ